MQRAKLGVEDVERESKKKEFGILSTLKEENGNLSVSCRIRLTDRALGRLHFPGERETSWCHSSSSADNCVLTLDSLILGLYELL